MAKADYILCDRCDSKIVYDGEGKIAEGLAALGLDKAPALCEACRAAAIPKEVANVALSERNALVDGAMLAAGMGHRLTRTQTAIMHDEIVRLRQMVDRLFILHDERDAIMREADKRVELRIAEINGLIGILNWCRNRMGAVALNDELDEMLDARGIDMPRDGGVNG